jgi:hypothetical protein
LTVNDPLPDDTMQERMQGIRGDIDQGLEDVSASARSMVDWKHYVKTYPWLCLGAAAAVGFLFVPKRPRAVSTSTTSPAKSPETGHRAADSTPSAVRGVVDMLVAAAVSLAVRETAAYVGQAAAGLMGASKPPETSDHDENCTS